MSMLWPTSQAGQALYFNWIIPPTWVHKDTKSQKEALTLHRKQGSLAKAESRTPVLANHHLLPGRTDGHLNNRTSKLLSWGRRNATHLVQGGRRATSHLKEVRCLVKLNNNLHYRAVHPWPYTDGTPQQCDTQLPVLPPMLHAVTRSHLLVRKSSFTGLSLWTTDLQHLTASISVTSLCRLPSLLPPGSINQ